MSRLRTSDLPSVTLRPVLAESHPRLWGSGPPSFSTCVTLVRRHVVVWDANGYYRELGVAHDATREQIRKAYQRKRGWRSPRLTYIFKQLLNPEVRRRYDATPLGQRFWDDYVDDEMRRAHVSVAIKLRSAGRVVEAEQFEDRHYAETMADWVPPSDDDWPWGYYLWGTRCDDTDRLRRWQSHLIEAFDGRPREISVGFFGESVNPSQVLARVVGYRLVVFINDETEPSDFLAHEAVGQVEDGLT